MQRTRGGGSGGKCPKALTLKTRYPHSGGKSAGSFFRSPFSAEPTLSQGSDSGSSVVAHADEPPRDYSQHWAELAQLAADEEDEHHAPPPLSDAAVPVGPAITLHQEIPLSLSQDGYAAVNVATESARTLVPSPVRTTDGGGQAPVARNVVKKRNAKAAATPGGRSAAKAASTTAPAAAGGEERRFCAATGKFYATVPWERCHKCANENNRGLKKCMEEGHLLRDPNVTYEEAVRLRSERNGSGAGQRRKPRTPPPVAVPKRARQEQEQAAFGGARVPVPHPLFGQDTDVAPQPVPAPQLPVVAVHADRVHQSLLAQALALQAVLYCAPSQSPVSAVPLAVELLKNLVAYPGTTGGVTAEHVAQLGGLIERLAAELPVQEHGRALGSLGAVLFGISPEGAIEQLLGLVIAQAHAGMDQPVRTRIGSRLAATADLLLADDYGTAAGGATPPF